MRVLVMPDAHLKTDLVDAVEKVMKTDKADYCVSLGDWSDDWITTVEDYHRFFKRFLEFYEKYCDKMHLCWGNHDYGYWRYPNMNSGYNVDADIVVRKYIRELYEYAGPITLTHVIDNVIFSHAGITNYLFKEYKKVVHRQIDRSFIDWINLELIDDRERLWQDSSPLWHRPTNKLRVNTFNPNIMQVVGHTPVMTVMRDNPDNILYTDTWSTNNRKERLGDKSLAIVDTESQTWEKVNALQDIKSGDTISATNI